MRKKQSVTQRVVLDEDSVPENKDDAVGESEKSKVDDESESAGNSTAPTNAEESNSESQSQTVVPDAGTSATESKKEPPKSIDKRIMETTVKEAKSDTVEQHNLFDEDGNAILPDGTLIIQPTDVDGDRPSSGPVAAPSEGSSLQFDFKDGNPDPKYTMSSQSAGGSAMSMSGSASEPGVLDVVKCTTCTTKLNPYHKDDLAVHPVLKVITCKRCMRWYNSVEWSKDEDGKDNQCRWCGEGGQLICCDVCHNTFCKTCIKRNLGRSVLQEIEDLPEDALWRCYVCDQGPLLPLQQGCAQVLEKVELYRMGKLQRKFRIQAGKKQSENKKPVPAAPATVTVSVTPVPTIRPQVGVRMTAPAVVNSTLGNPRASITTPSAISSQTRPHLAARIISSGPRNTGPRPALPNSGINLMNTPGGMNVNRPIGNVIQPTRYPGSQLGRPPTAVRSARPVGRPANVTLTQPRTVQPNQSVNAAAANAGSSAATEEWYEQNCSLREILREVNSVDPSNIELALKTTLKELQSWTRKCNHLENELRGALNDAQRRTVVHKFKSTFRLNLLLRLGKIHTLMQKESGLQMAVAAQRSAVMAAQAQSQGRSTHLTTPIVNANAKKLIVTSNRSNIPAAVTNRIQTGKGTTGVGVIDLTEDNSGFMNKRSTSNLISNAVPPASTLAASGLHISHVTSKVESKVNQPSFKSVSSVNNVASTSSATSGKIRQRSGNSAHVDLLSSEDEDDEGMIDDRNDKTWIGNVSRSTGTRRKSARLAAKVPGSVTEGSESSQGVEESDDNQPKMLVRIPYARRGKRAKKTNEDDDKKMDVDNDYDESRDAAPDSPFKDDAGISSEIKDEAIEVVVDPSVVTADSSSKRDPEHTNSSNKVSSETTDEPESRNHDKTEAEKETPVVTNGVNSTESGTGDQTAEGKVDKSKDNVSSTESSNSITQVKIELENESSGDKASNSQPETSVSDNKPAEPVEPDEPDEPDESLHEANANASEAEAEVGSKEILDSSEKGEFGSSTEVRPDSSVDGQVEGEKSTDAQCENESNGNGNSTSPERESAKCITVSMWGPADDGDAVVSASTDKNEKDGAASSIKGKRRASELENADDNAKRQKLDQ